MLPLVIDSWDGLPSPAGVLVRLPSAPYCFVLESQGGPADIARYSFVGQRPFLCFQARGRTLTVREAGAVAGYQWEGDPYEALESLLKRYSVAPAPGLPPFSGGAVGYLAYDLGRHVERLPATARDDLALPEAWLGFYDHCLAFDHLAGRTYAIALPLPGREAQAIQGAEQLARIARAEQSRPGPASPAVALPLATCGGLASNFTRADYLRAVERALGHIGAGHVYQVNLSQRLTAHMPCSAEALYHRLRAANPAPFAAFLDLGDIQLVSASPERFLRLDPVTQCVETRPIKGTRPRGVTPAEDSGLKEELLTSAKDQAELVMIVDLERNDLGKVCQYGTVRVPQLGRVEAYPTVFHTVATVQGRLRPGTRRADLLRAAFPGGSVTGAPKVRAMQIIEELERLRRHVYCGAIGYLGFDGGLDLNIAIRTITVKGEWAYFHAGGGIVADSQPEAEYEETLDKARALAEALGLSVDGLSGQSGSGHGADLA